MKFSKFLLLLLLLFILLSCVSFSQTGSGSGGSSTPSIPYYSDPDSNYAKFSQQNFNYLRQDTSYAGRKKLKYFGREYYFWKTRLGNNDTPGNTKDYGRAINILSNHPCLTIDSANWNSEGPFRSFDLQYRQAMGLIDALD